MSGHPGVEDEANFARTYKAGEKVTYSATMGDAHNSMTADLVFEVNKVLPSGRAEVAFHLDNVNVKVEGGQQPTIVATGVTVKTSAHNMPETFKAEDGNFNIIGFFGMVAGCTLDKKVTAGASGSWTWSGGDLEFKGNTKVLKVDLGARRLEAEIKATGTHKGKDPLGITFTSTFDLADGSLVESKGRLGPPGNESQAFEMTFKRKP